MTAYLDFLAAIHRPRQRSTVPSTSTGNGKVVVNRSMSLDGFIAGPGHAMDWVFDFVAPDEFPDISAATGAMLVGRRIYKVGKRGIETASRGKVSGEDYGGGWSGPQFILTHRLEPLGADGRGST